MRLGGGRPPRTSLESRVTGATPSARIVNFLIEAAVAPDPFGREGRALAKDGARVMVFLRGRVLGSHVASEYWIGPRMLPR